MVDKRKKKCHNEYLWTINQTTIAKFLMSVTRGNMKISKIKYFKEWNNIDILKYGIFPTPGIIKKIVKESKC